MRTAWAGDRRTSYSTQFNANATDFTVIGRGGNGLSRSPFFIRQTATIRTICLAGQAISAYFVSLPAGGGAALL
ncbi:hypothetical protein UC34_07815 [Pandoraea vervacti]|uniref:Uncharacterized protein n=1 Tax=Pandoraea vervacti TaxID=656178 RepID=A0ABM5SWM9_9BURK|nr:hypothetical protein UC34_07815 [Pandoraea vervacti]